MRREAWQLGLMALGIGLLTTRGLDTGDAAVHLDLAIAIAERGEATLTIDPGSLFVPTRPLAGGLFYQAPDGLRSASAPGHAWMAVPLVKLAGLFAPSEPPRFDPLFLGGAPREVIRPLQRDARVIVFVLLGPASAALAVVFLVLAAGALGLSRGARLASASALALGSPLLAYAGTTWTQLPACAALAYVLFRLTAREVRPRGSDWSLGVAAALLVVLRPDHLLHVLVAGAVLYRIDRGWRRAPSRSMARLLVPTSLAIALLTWWGLPESGGGWSLATLPEGVVGLLVSPRTGLLVYAPFVLLVPLGVARLYTRARPLAFLVAGWSAASLAVYGGWFDWPASLAYGPRFLVPLLPPLALAFGVAYDSLGVRARVVAAACLSLGLAVELPGALLAHARIDEVERFASPTFVVAWRTLLTEPSIGLLGVDSASTYVGAYSLLAMAVAATGLVLARRG